MKGYTKIDNAPLRDKALSLRAKGLLAVMLSLPPSWRFSVRGLAAICKEGVAAMRETLLELEQTGYLHRGVMRDAQGKIRGTSYEICAHPWFEKPIAVSPNAEFTTQLKKDLINKRNIYKDFSPKGKSKGKGGLLRDAVLRRAQEADAPGKETP